MSLYDDVQIDAHDILSDPDFAQPDIVLIKKVVTEPSEEWEKPEVSSRYFVLNGVSSIRQARYDSGTLVTERHLLITASYLCNEISASGSVLVQGVPLQPAEPDTVRIGGRERRILNVVPVPPTGPTIVWKIRVAD